MKASYKHREWFQIFIHWCVGKRQAESESTKATHSERHQNSNPSSMLDSQQTHRTACIADAPGASVLGQSVVTNVNQVTDGVTDSSFWKQKEANQDVSIEDEFEQYFADMFA